jgi:choline dehydrogenase
MAVQVDTVRSVEVPTRMVHGPGALSRLGEIIRELGVKRPMLVTDKGIAAIGLADRALTLLRNEVFFSDVVPNPDIELVDRAAALYREEGCDGLVALGGGSSMDTAKSIGVVVTHGGSIKNYEYDHDPITCRIPPSSATPVTTTSHSTTPWPCTLWSSWVSGSAWPIAMAGISRPERKWPMPRRRADWRTGRKARVQHTP